MHTSSLSSGTLKQRAQSLGIVRRCSAAKPKQPAHGVDGCQQAAAARPGLRRRLFQLHDCFSCFIIAAAGFIAVSRLGCRQPPGVWLLTIRLLLLRQPLHLLLLLRRLGLLPILLLTLLRLRPTLPLSNGGAGGLLLPLACRLLLALRLALWLGQALSHSRPAAAQARATAPPRLSWLLPLAGPRLLLRRCRAGRPLASAGTWPGRLHLICCCCAGARCRCRWPAGACASQA